MAVDTTVDTAARTARDRLVSMLVLTALFHGLVLLGVSFVPPRPGQSPAQGLEVLLVSDELPETAGNDTAVYRAQRNQLGSGNSERQSPTQTGAEAATAGAPTSAAATAREAAHEALLASQQPRASVNYTVSADTPPDAAQFDVPTPAQTASADLADDPLRLRGPQREELLITADTRTDELAPYLDSWRRRIERVGTLNYPNAARSRGLSGNPVVEVIVARDGRLLSAQIQRSSGHPQLDAAALQILRLASPFEPFPADISAQHERLRFAYEWQFNGGQLAGGTLALP